MKVMEQRIREEGRDIEETRKAIEELSERLTTLSRQHAKLKLGTKSEGERFKLRTLRKEIQESQMVLREHEEYQQLCASAQRMKIARLKLMKEKLLTETILHRELDIQLDVLLRLKMKKELAVGKVVARQKAQYVAKLLKTACRLWIRVRETSVKRLTHNEKEMRSLVRRCKGGVKLSDIVTVSHTLLQQAEVDASRTLSRFKLEGKHFEPDSHFGNDVEGVDKLVLSGGHTVAHRIVVRSDDDVFVQHVHALVDGGGGGQRGLEALPQTVEAVLFTQSVTQEPERLLGRSEPYTVKSGELKHWITLRFAAPLHLRTEGSGVSNYWLGLFTVSGGSTIRLYTTPIFSSCARTETASRFGTPPRQFGRNTPVHAQPCLYTEPAGLWARLLAILLDNIAVRRELNDVVLAVIAGVGKKKGRKPLLA
eukprot:PLAT3165.2.p1 GENE.PLAT3165.2~~PLAT3165.2.p1  ORF type:complete len:424 (+),score=256.28 PLAT3165.2:140-1411(+)